MPAAAPDELGTVSYDIDLDGTVTAVHEPVWRQFATENGAQALADPAAVVGRPLQDFIAGPARDHVDMLVRMLRRGMHPEFAYTFRCDAPHKDRYMRMHIATILGPDGAASGLRFSSTVLHEEERLDVVLMHHQDPGEDAPFLTMCSYCKRVRHDDEWVLPRDYEASGAPTRVRLTHGICPDCERDIVVPMLNSLAL